MKIMKKLVILALITTLSFGEAVFAKTETDESTNIMTVQSIEWLPQIEEQGENKLLKAKVNFHYEGELIAVGYDFNFETNCYLQKRKRGGFKYLYYEVRDLTNEDLEIEGPHDFSVTFVFTLSPQEFAATKKRPLVCNTGTFDNDGLVKTEFAPGVKAYSQRIKPKGNTWKVL